MEIAPENSEGPNAVVQMTARAGARDAMIDDSGMDRKLQTVAGTRRMRWGDRTRRAPGLLRHPPQIWGYVNEWIECADLKLRLVDRDVERPLYRRAAQAIELDNDRPDGGIGC